MNYTRRYHSPCAPSTFSDPVRPSAPVTPDPPGPVISHVRGAMNGIGPLARQWASEPQVLVYDLCNEIMRLRAKLGLGVEGAPNAN